MLIPVGPGFIINMPEMHIKGAFQGAFDIIEHIRWQKLPFLAVRFSCIRPSLLVKLRMTSWIKFSMVQIE